MAFLVATTSLPAVYRPNGYARTTTAGTPHARANIIFEHRSHLSHIFEQLRQIPEHLRNPGLCWAGHLRMAEREKSVWRVHHVEYTYYDPHESKYDSQWYYEDQQD